MAKKTPDIEVEIPPNEECPDGKSRCDRKVAEEAIERVLGHSKVRWTTLIPPVTVRLTSEGGRIDEYPFPSEEWDCLSVFIEHLRSRLPVPDTTELSKIVQTLLESISEQERNSSDLEERIEVFERLVMQSEAPLEVETLRSTVGLETRVRSRRGLEKIARDDLRGERNPSIRRNVRNARRAIQIYDQIKTGKRLFLRSLSREEK